jgi:hypothetical protein
LIVTLDAIKKRDERDKKFLAALQGVDLDDNSSEDDEDITKVKGFRAEQDGFGIGLGLGHIVEDNNISD